LEKTGSHDDNGMMVGEWKLYHKNGKIGAVGIIKDGEKTGEWKYYDENGNLKKTK